MTTRATRTTHTAPAASRVPRLVTVWFPDWSAHALAALGDADPHHPLAVIAAHRVVARSAAAATAGVRVGMRRRDAHAVCPSLTIVDPDPARDARAFEPVLAALADVVPTLEVTAPGHVAFPTRGPSRRMGGDAALAAHLEQCLARLVPHAPRGIGIADGRVASTMAARRAAHQGCAVVVDDGGSAEFLAPVPTRALVEVAGLPEHFVDLLVRLGLRRLGDVAAMPAPDLLARFGVVGRLAHLAARGDDETPLYTGPPPLTSAVEIAFDDPLAEVQALVFRARGASEGLVADLGARGHVCTRLVVEIHTETGRRSCRAWYRAGGLSSAAMVERVRWQIEGWATTPSGGEHAGDHAEHAGDHAEHDGVVRLALIPDEVRVDTGHQVGFWGGETEADRTALAALTRLSALLGADAVTVPEWRGGRDHPVALVPATSVDWAERTTRVTPSPASGPWPGRLPAPSPACRHVPPVPIEVLDHDGRRLMVSARGLVSGRPARLARDDPPGRHSAHIVAWAGPWPVEERWWDLRARRAARLQVLVRVADDIHTAHLVEVREGRWWLIADYS